MAKLRAEEHERSLGVSGKPAGQVLRRRTDKISTAEDLENLVGEILKAIRRYDVYPNEHNPAAGFTHVIREARLFEVLGGAYPEQEVVRRALSFLEEIQAVVRLRIGGNELNGYGMRERGIQYLNGKKLGAEELERFAFDVPDPVARDQGEAKPGPSDNDLGHDDTESIDEFDQAPEQWAES